MWTYYSSLSGGGGQHTLLVSSCLAFPFCIRSSAVTANPHSVHSGRGTHLVEGMEGRWGGSEVGWRDGGECGRKVVR